MRSIVSICNDALTKLGTSAIVSLGDDSEPARLCARRWPSVRDAVLRAHPWNCAIARATLAPLAEPVAADGARRFPLPVDCLRAIGTDAEFWAIEDGRVRAARDRLDLVYIRRVEAAESFDALLAETLASRLAAELAYPLVNSTTLAESLWRLYEQRLREARSVDAREGGGATIVDEDPWRRARS